MSISARNKEEKQKRDRNNKILGRYKLCIDEGMKLEDLNFEVFGDQADYYFDFMKKYVEGKKIKKGFII